MTLKQFFQLAGGIIIGLVIFRLPLPVLLKYPLVGLSVLAGILMAFVPINGRPFSNWLVAFIRAVYAPTEFIWRLDTTPPTAPTNPVVPPPKTSQVSTTNTPVSPITAKLDASRVASSVAFNATPTLPDSNSSTISTQTQFLKIEPVNNPAPTPPPTPPYPTPSLVLTSNPVVEESLLPSSNTIPLPTAPTQTINTSPVTKITPASTTPNPTPNTPPPPTASTTNQLVTPSLPNILTGLVTDPQGAILEGAIVEIIDTKTGIPARALRTNRAGIFQIATALSPGSYTINVEKDKYIFGSTSINITNNIVQPVIIKATSSTN
jgi:hypothetical protein